MFNLILEFKQWAVDQFLLLNEANYLPVLNSVKDFIKEKNPLVKNNLGQEVPFSNFINQTFNDFDFSDNIREEDFKNKFLEALFMRGFMGTSRIGYDTSFFIPDNFLKLTPKEKKDLLNPIVNMAAFILNDIYRNKDKFKDYLQSNKDNLVKAFNDFLLNPKGRVLGKDSKGKPKQTLFQSLLPKKSKEASFAVTKAKGKSGIGSLEGLQGEEQGSEMQGFQPTEKELISKYKARDLPKVEFDDLLRLSQKQFQKYLLEITPAQAKQNLDANLSNHLNDYKNDILTVDNLQFVSNQKAKNVKEVSDTANYLKIKTLYDISTKFQKSIAEFEGHTTDVASTGQRYAVLPKKEYLLGIDSDGNSTDSYFKKLSPENKIDEIKRYIVAHGKSNKNPIMVRNFFLHLYDGMPNVKPENDQLWKTIVNNAYSQAEKENPELFSPETMAKYPTEQMELSNQEDLDDEEKIKLDIKRSKSAWINLSGHMKAKAEEDLESFLPDELNEPGKEQDKKFVMDKLNDMYYGKIYSNDKTNLVSTVNNFQKFIVLYRVLLGLSAIQIAKVDAKKNIDKDVENLIRGVVDNPSTVEIESFKQILYAGTNLPVCKQLQIWLESAFRDPIEGRASFEEMKKIKDIKKIKELLEKNENLIEKVFSTPLENICNNKVFGTGEEAFELEDYSTWETRQGEYNTNYLATLKIKDLPEEYIKQIAKGKVLNTLEDVLELRDSKSKEDQQIFKDLLKKSKEFFNVKRKSIVQAREKDIRSQSEDMAKEILKLRNQNTEDQELINKIAKQIRSGPSINSPLWQDLQKIKYQTSFSLKPEKDKPEQLVSGGREKEQFGVPYAPVSSPSSEIPKGQVWQPKEPEAPTTTPSPIYAPLFGSRPKRGLM